MVKVFSTRIHGMLDYGAALLMVIVPRVLGLPGHVTTLLTVLGIGTVLYSLVTRYELSIAKLLPMPGHLMIDGLAGVLLLGAAFLFRDGGTAVWLTLLIFGLLEIGAALLTDPVSPIEAADSRDTTTTSSRTTPATNPNITSGTATTVEKRGENVRIYDDNR